MVKLALTALRSAEVRLMLDVLRNRHLGRMTAMGTMEQRAFHLCRCEGYRLALDDFEALGQLETPKEQIEADFRPPDESDEP